MAEFEHYERHVRRDRGEEWHLRGRLREVFLADRVESVERILEAGEKILEEKRRRLVRFHVDGRPYVVKAYRAGGLTGGTARRRALEQLRVGMRAVGLGLDVVPIEAAAIRPPWVCLFAPEQIGWRNLATVLGDRAAAASERWRILEAFARFCRRLHDAGLYSPDQALSRIHVRVRPASQDFQVSELDGTAIVDPMPDDARAEMVGALLASAGGESVGDGLRFLRAYTESDEGAREMLPRVIRDLAVRVRPPAIKPKRRRAKVGRLSIDPFDIEYVKKDTEMGIDAGELLELYRAGLEAPGLKVIRSGDVRNAWKSALTAGPGPGVSPLACFARRQDKAGFLLFRTHA